MNELLSGGMTTYIVIGVVVGVVAILVIATLTRQITRQKIVSIDTALAIATEEGVQRIMLQSGRLAGFLPGVSEYVYRGRKAARRFSYLHQDHSKTGQIYTRSSLMDRRTGSLSLLVTQLDLAPFEAMSADHHVYNVHTSLRFRLDGGRLMRAFEYQNVAEVLMSRLKSAARAEINSRENQDVAAEINEIREAIKTALCHPEDVDIDNKKKWLENPDNQQEYGDKILKAYFEAERGNGALGIEILDIDLSPEEHPDAPRFATALQKSSGEASGDEPLSDPGRSIMEIPTQHLDNVRDLFLKNFQKVRKKQQKIAQNHLKEADDKRAAYEKIKAQYDEEMQIAQQQIETRRQETTSEDGVDADPLPDPKDLIPANVQNAYDEALRALNLAQNVVKKDEDEARQLENDILDAEQKAYNDANRALLQMLEMYTRENIARAQAHAKSVLVIPAADTDLAKNNLFRNFQKWLDDQPPEQK